MKIELISLSERKSEFHFWRVEYLIRHPESKKTSKTNLFKWILKPKFSINTSNMHCIHVTADSIVSLHIGIGSEYEVHRFLSYNTTMV